VDAFTLSYRQLPPGPQRVFRLLGLHPGADFDAPSVAALTGLPLGEAADMLDDLIDVHLVDEPEPGVYRLHDLLREFAAALAADLPQPERSEALLGVLDHQLHATSATVRPGSRPTLDHDLRSPVPLRPDLVEALDDPSARLERERRNLARFVDAADAAGLSEYTWQIPRAAWRYLWTHGYIDDVAGLYRRALAVAERNRDQWATATALNYLASAIYRRGEIDDAITTMERCLRIRKEIGDGDGVSFSLGNLAASYYQAGHWRKAMELARGMTRNTTQQRSLAEANTRLNVLAICSRRLGDLPASIRYYRLRLLAQLELGDLIHVQDTLMALAAIRYQAGELAAGEALRRIHLMLRLHQREGFGYAEADGHDEVARVLQAEGRYAEAVAHHRSAIEVAITNRDPHQETRFRSGLGATLLALGDRAAARAEFTEALRLGRRLRLRYPIALAQVGLGDCAGPDDPAEARQLWRQARDVLAELEAPELAAVERRLAGGEDHLQAAAGRGTMVT
jgi:tetratricopeptide (TPR) repeat protein